MRIFSGIQPTGTVHLGNYLGAIRQYVELQNGESRIENREKEQSQQPRQAAFSAHGSRLTAHEPIYCIVDLHALTVLPDPAELKKRTYDTAALLFAAGLDHKRSTLFVQSMNPGHAELAWVMTCLTTMGELGRMTQYKEKRGTTEERITGVGLFTYPALMAADILLYQTELVPVGEDQTQHVELARDLAKRFNQRYGDTFVVPELRLKQEAARIMGLDDPTVKMSKSAASSYNYVALTDSPDLIEKKIMRAVTDSGSDIVYTSDKPALKNLLTIYAGFTGEVPDGIVNRYAGRGYAEFKRDLAEVVIEHLKPIQEQYTKLREDEHVLETLLRHGAEKIAPLAHETIKTAYGRLGLVR